MCIGIYMIFVGMLFVMLHFGVMPVHVAERIREGASATRRTLRQAIVTVMAEQEIVHASARRERGPQSPISGRTPVFEGASVELTSVGPGPRNEAFSNDAEPDAF